MAITYLHIPLGTFLLPVRRYIYSSPFGFLYPICPTICVPPVSGGSDKPLQLGTG
jgi:hypothetical protein